MEPELLKASVALKKIKQEFRGDVPAKDIDVIYKAARKAEGARRQADDDLDLVEKLNDDYFRMGSKIGTISEEGELVLMSKADFSNRVAHYAPEATGIDAPHEVFLRSPNHRSYSGVICDPDLPKEHDSKLNMWMGFGVEPIDGDVTPFLEYVFEILGNGDDAFANYVLDWCAWKVQNPAKPVKSTVLLYSDDEGTGKSTLGSIMRKIFGRHSRTVSSAQMAAKHNGWVLGAMFVGCDELDFSRSTIAMEKMKVMVTEETIRVEPKYIDSYDAPNTMAILNTSNSRNALPTSRSDRRIAMNELSKSKMQDTDYWGGFYAWLDADGLGVILKYLLERDVSSWDSQRDRPVTPLYLSSKRASLRDVGAWLGDCIDEESWGLRGNGHLGEGWISKAAIYQAYVKWHQKQREFDRKTPLEAFWIALYEFKLGEDKSQASDGTRRVKFPDWEILRVNFDRALREG